MNLKEFLIFSSYFNHRTFDILALYANKYNITNNEPTKIKSKQIKYDLV